MGLEDGIALVDLLELLGIFPYVISILLVLLITTQVKIILWLNKHNTDYMLFRQDITKNLERLTTLTEEHDNQITDLDRRTSNMQSVLNLLEKRN